MKAILRTSHISDRPILKSWTPLPELKFFAHLIGENGKFYPCILNPFVCTKVTPNYISGTSEGKEWHLDRHVYRFYAM